MAKNNNSSTSFYKESLFDLAAAPEYTQGEACLASLYRALGFESVSEGDVYDQYSIKGAAARNSIETSWESLASALQIKGEGIYSWLSSPMPSGTQKEPGKYLMLYPLIPEFGYFSNAARFAGNPWNPGNLVKGMVSLGASSFDSAREKWKALYDTLQVSASDDQWAQIVERIVRLKKVSNIPSWNFVDLPVAYKTFQFSKEEDFTLYNFPSKQFLIDIIRLAELKKQLTRRQWVSIFESFLRMAMATHVLWVCHINTQLDILVRRALVNKYTFGKSELLNFLFSDFSTLELDHKSDSFLRNKVKNFVEAKERILITLNYWGNDIVQGTFSNIDHVHGWLKEINNRSANNDAIQIRDLALSFFEQKSGLLACLRGYSKNIYEYLRHSLGQKTTMQPEERNFDQGYWIRKDGKNKSAPWVFELGPVASICAVALAIPGSQGTASDISTYLQKYGIKVDADQLSRSSLGRSLFEMGFTSDNPDGEKGIIINNPFKI